MICICLGILAALLAVAAWHSPKYLRHAAAHLIARAEGLEAYVETQELQLKHWRGTLGVGPTAALIRRLKEAR